MSHTPGPWSREFSENGGYDSMTDAYRITSVDARQHFIADVDLGSYGQSPRSRTIANDRAAEAGANAQLIAAAPDLLSALRLCRAIIGCGSRGARLRAEPEAITAAEAAIAKAEGR